jgi:hypothetical protein
MGHIASFFYLKYTTMAFFRQHLGPAMDLKVRYAAFSVASRPDISVIFVHVGLLEPVLSNYQLLAKTRHQKHINRRCCTRCAG